jgi:hypothetical protein
MRHFAAPCGFFEHSNNPETEPTTVDATSRSSHPPPPEHKPKKHKLADKHALARALAGIVVDQDDRDFIARCIAREGPPHHQGASFVIITLARQIAERMGASPSPHRGPRPSMKVPPHHARDDNDEREFAIALPVSAIARVERDPERARALIECLLDGPTHHALANVAMVALLESILAELDREAPR